MNITYMRIVIAFVLGLALSITCAQAAIQTFDNKADFLTATAAASATGPLPDLGIQTPERTTVGSVTFSVAPGGDGFFIGANNVTGLPSPDWYPQTSGNDIALFHEHLQVETAQPVYALGFDFVEPNTTMPAWGGSPVDSTYEVVLYAGQTEVGRFTFNAPDDEQAFIGVWSDVAFDRVTISDVTNDPNAVDDEYFGEFYSSAVALPCANGLCQTNDVATFLAVTQAQPLTGVDGQGQPVPLPNLGATQGPVTIGGARLQGPQLFVGTAGAQVVNNDWTQLLPGPDIALTGNGPTKHLRLRFAQPVEAFGFAYVEPQNGPNVGRKFSEGTVTLTLRLGNSVVGETVFNGANDAVTYVGLWAPGGFDVAELRIVGGFGNKFISTVFAGELNPGIVRSSGTIYVVDPRAGTANRGALFAVSPSTGNRTLVNDFGDGRQGQPGRNPSGVAVEATGYVLVADKSAGTNAQGALFRVNPRTRTRRILSDFGGPGQGPLGQAPLGVAVEASGNILVVDLRAGLAGRGALFRVNRSTGTRTLLSDFGQSGQGPLGLYPVQLAVEASGNILVVDLVTGPTSKGKLFRVNPNTGNRTVLSDFGQGPNQLDYPGDIAVEVSGNILIVEYWRPTKPRGSLFRVDRVTGFRTLLSDFGDTGQGPLGVTSFGVEVEASGTILVLDTNLRGTLFRVNPDSGFRTLLSDFGDPAQGPLGEHVSSVAAQK